jgi:DNA-binding IclR family transcriptional regulator
MEVSIMGRKLDQDRLENVLQTIRKHDGQYKANDVAKALDLHPQTVARLLASVENHSVDLLYEDDRGFLGLFKK